MDRQKDTVITWRGQDFEGKGRQEVWPGQAQGPQGNSHLHADNQQQVPCARRGVPTLTVAQGWPSSSPHAAHQAEAPLWPLPWAGPKWTGLGMPNLKAPGTTQGLRI